MSLVTFTVDSGINLYLPQNPETINPELNGELAKVYNALRNLQIAITQYAGVGQREITSWSMLTPADTIQLQNLSRVYVQASENIPLGNTINFHDPGGGLLRARRADANSASIKPAHGFCTTLGGITSGQFGEVMLFGLCPYISGLAIGQTYYQSTTPGVITNVKPAGPNLGETVGFAVGGSLLMFMPLLP